MTSKKTPPPLDEYEISDPAEFGRNMVRVAMQSQKILSEYMEGQQNHQDDGVSDPLNVGSAFTELLNHMASDPSKLLEAQFEFWKAQSNLWQTSWRRFMGEEVEPVIEPVRGDKRFRHEDWAENTVFDFIKQSYLLTANWLHDTVADVEGLDDESRRKVDFYTKQFSDAISPTNFALTNPAVLRATMSSNGENLVKGLDNLLHDLEEGDGKLNISQTDMTKFEVGRNIAVSKGKVMFRNDLLELLQFDPLTDEVYERPLLIFPPWINKYYILDLRQDNSFIKWATEHGYTVFVASWVNPDEKLAEKEFEDYMFEGVLESLDAIEKATGMKEVNAIGYCIGGTMLSTTLAYMAAKGDKRITSATFFASQADFSEAGELQIFVDDKQLDALEQQMIASGGYLKGSEMANTFNMLRANDLIWNYVINNYMLGKDPFPFDLLYWNADATRMPYKTHLFYLREYYRDNMLARGEMVIRGEKLDLGKVKIPIFLQSSQTDHIAPYNSIYKSTQLFGGKVKFIMAGSGHIAGVVNHPDAKKYQYWTNTHQPDNIEDWVTGATEHPGSWWPEWHKWLSRKSGKKVAARTPGDGNLKPIMDAPGSYVLVKS